MISSQSVFCRYFSDVIFEVSYWYTLLHLQNILIPVRHRLQGPLWASLSHTSLSCCSWCLKVFGAMWRCFLTSNVSDVWFGSDMWRSVSKGHKLPASIIPLGIFSLRTFHFSHLPNLSEFDTDALTLQAHWNLMDFLSFSDARGYLVCLDAVLRQSVGHWWWSVLLTLSVSCDFSMSWP